MFVFCERCGLIKKKSALEKCPACDYLLKDVPKEYLTESGNMFKSQEIRKTFVDDIKNGEVYNNELSEMRDKLLSEKEKQNAESVNEKVKKYNESKVVLKCPVCGNNNLSTISNVTKLAKVTAFGVLGAGDLGKKWRCNSCGHKF